MNQNEWNINHRYEIALRNLNSNGWLKMNEMEKLENLQAIEDKNALENHRIPAEIKTETLAENELGYQRENTIVINSQMLNQEDFLEVIDTYYHEGSHIQDWQANFFNEVRSNYTDEEFAARNTPIPDPEINWEGYENHPAERAAREAGIKGVEKTLEDQNHILEVDNEKNTGINQILTTHDYIALDELDNSIESDFENSEDLSVEESIDYSVNMEDDGISIEDDW